MIGTAAQNIVEKSKNVVSERFANLDLNVTNLADYLNVSINHLSRTFKSVEGENIATYILHTKIAKSCEFLRETDISVREISLLCGFCDFSNYWKNFKKVMKMSPAVYRQHYGLALKKKDIPVLQDYSRLPMSDNVNILFKPEKINGRPVKNRIVFQPLECGDGNDDGSPSEFTIRRYNRFSSGGAGIIWFESVAIVPEGRSGRLQLHITESNVDAFKKVVHDIKRKTIIESGFEPLVIMQATHSGRYSAPNGILEPLIVYENPFFEKNMDKVSIVTDDYLKNLEDVYANTARLAQRAGFDGIDIKSCHRYLMSDLLSAYMRRGSYGGSFENRTRLLRNSVKAAKAASNPDFIITTRLNVYDGFPFPFGFGVNVNSGIEPDYDESLKLIKLLSEDIELINISIGNPFVQPHLNRPFDKGGYLPPENPVDGVKRLIDAAGIVQRANKKLKVVCSGLSYLKDKSVNLAAGAIEKGYCTFAGWGRLALAYPDFPQHIESGNISKQKCCMLCSRCSSLLRNGERTRCVMKDDSYQNIEKEIFS